VDYFLVVWDFIDYARKQGIPVGPGRGSGAGRIVAYALKITNIDPMRYQLLFERFLNPERVSLPDIDIDFCERRRGEVIDYVTRKYGRENVAQIITFGTMKAKAVVRDVGRVLEMPFADVDKVAKQIPAALDMTLDKALEESEPLRQMEQQDPKVKELRELAVWSEGMVWTSPERHCAMSSILKAQIDWIPLSSGAVRPTQGTTLAVMQVSGGSQSFNAVNQMRVLGRWMRMITIPNQSSVAKAFAEFDEAGRMKPSSYYERVVDVMEELVKFTLLTRDCSDYLVDRYSERRESAEELSKRVNQRSI